MKYLLWAVMVLCAGYLVAFVTVFMQVRMSIALENMKSPPAWAVNLALGQDSCGDLVLPCFQRSHGHTDPWWDRPANPWNPFHWPYYLMTIATGWVVWVEP